MLPIYTKCYRVNPIRILVTRHGYCNVMIYLLMQEYHTMLRTKLYYRYISGNAKYKLHVESLVFYYIAVVLHS